MAFIVVVTRGTFFLKVGRQASFLNDSLYPLLLGRLGSFDPGCALLASVIQYVGQMLALLIQRIGIGRGETRLSRSEEKSVWKAIHVHAVECG